MSAHLGPDRLKRHEYWHALPVGWAQLDYPTFLERRRTLIAKVIRDGFSTLWDDRTPTNRDGTLADLLEAGESQTLEYKSTARWNVHTDQPDKKMEQVIVKAVCGLLNGEGGTLLIGVDESGAVLGLQHDYDTLGAKGNCDGYELFLRQLLDANLSIATAGVVNIRFESVHGRDVCVTYATASGKPAFAKPLSGNAGPTDFWVHVGNLTKQLHGDDMVQYQSAHWG